MVALDARDVHAANDVQALFGVGVVAHDIPQAGVVSAFLLFDVFQDNLERLQVGVDVRNDGKLHESSSQFQTRETRLWLRPRPLLLP